MPILCDDVLHWAETYSGPKFHAALLDPPYELNFMSKSWDRSGIAFRSDTWRALAHHLLPGAFVMAFASSRGYHRLACALEDSGLIIHPAIGWCNSSRFPKATRIDTAIDREAGVEQEYIGPRVYADGTIGHASNNEHAGWQRPWKNDPDAVKRNTGIHAPATPLAHTWAGHRYGLQALKPALEFIAVAQVPYRGRPVDSITQTGAGAYWIEGARIAGPEPHHNYGRPHGVHSWFGPAGEPSITPASGRWPSNFAMCHLPTCRPIGTRRVHGSHPSGQGQRTLKPWHILQKTTQAGSVQDYNNPDGTEEVQAYSCAEGCPVAELDAQAGERKGGGGHRGGSNYADMGYHGNGTIREAWQGYQDHGPVSRFFPCFDWSLDVAEQLAQAAPIFYAAKASRGERDEGLFGMPMQECTRYQEMTTQGPLPQQTPRRPTRQRNIHPTVKPISLCTWLATLLLPPAAYKPRRLLNPFAGSGTECIGAVLAGWDEVLGIEMDPDTVALAQQRLRYWDTQIAAQLSLFG